MNDDELEKQARLWLVESTIDKTKSEALQETLTQAQPKASRRHLGKLGGLALIALALPVGVVVSSLARPPLGRIERLQSAYIQTHANTAVTFGLLQDGSVVAQSSDPTEFWSAQSVSPVNLIPPESVFPKKRFKIESFGIHKIISDDTLLGSISLREGIPGRVGTAYWGVLWQKGKWTALPPLSGFPTADASTYSPDGPLGVSTQYLSVPYTPAGTSPTPSSPKTARTTLWRDGKPEELPWTDLMPLTFRDRNGKGDVLVGEQSQCRVLSGTRVLPVALPLLDSSGKVDRDAIPKRIGKDSMLVGTMVKGDSPVGALWDSPTTPPHPLWETLSPYGYTCSYCEDIDDEGKVIGMMTHKITGESVPFVWKAGRYLDINTLLPKNSGWHLTSADRISGRFVIGQGTYQGKPALYRLTLPPGFP